MNIKKLTSGYPDGVFAMFFMQMFSMVGFMMLFALLTLYCTHVLHFTDQRAYDVSDTFNDQIFAVSILGGYVANRFLGYRYAFILSGILAIIGLGLLLTTNTTAFYVGLGMYVLSQGIMVPSMYVLLGMLYSDNDPMRDSGFIIAYIGMNVGGFFASLLSGPISEKFGYHTAFFVGLFFAVLTLVNYLMYQYKFKPAKVDRITRDHANRISTGSKLTGFFIVLIFIPIISELMNHPAWNNITLILLGILSIIIVMAIACRQKPAIRKKMIVFLILSIISMGFWALYLLAPTVLPLFTERNINRQIFSWIIPTASYSSLDPFFIITVGPILSYLWIRLSKKNITMSTPAKFSAGMILMGSGYLILALGIVFHQPTGLIAMIWIIASYFLQTMGELFVGPIGFSMVGNYVPSEHIGLMMGIWQLFTGIAGVFTDYLSKLINTGDEKVTNPLITNHAYTHTFILCGSITLIVGLITLLLTPWLNKLGSGKTQDSYDLTETTIA